MAYRDPFSAQAAGPNRNLEEELGMAVSTPPSKKGAGKKPVKLKKLSRYTDLWAHFTTETVPPELQATHFRCKWCVKSLKEGIFEGTSGADEIRNIRRVTTRDACVHMYKCPYVPDTVKNNLTELLAAHVKEVRMPRQSPMVIDRNHPSPNSMIGNVAARSSGCSNNNIIAAQLLHNSKERLKHECIGAVRKLAKQDLITADQKRVLLTDIITCSARDDTSNVQMAYELLVAGDVIAGNTEGLMEFADQCRVFAEELLMYRNHQHPHPHHPNHNQGLDLRDTGDI